MAKITEKQRVCIQRIESNLGIRFKFRGKTKEDASAYISKYLERSRDMVDYKTALGYSTDYIDSSTYAKHVISIFGKRKVGEKGC